MAEYTSTRSKKDLSVSKAIIEGLSGEGGLYVLKNIKEKQIDYRSLTELSYQEIAFKVMSVFFDDFNSEELKACIKKAYDHSFSCKDVVYQSQLGPFRLLELYHGPTAAFKDVALQFLPHSLNLARIKQKLNEKIMILTATSGDTGKAALEGFKDVENTAITVFYPHKGVSKIQELQMVTTGGSNTAVAAIEGNFDDCQRAVKEIFASGQLKAAMKEKGFLLSSDNSINISRLVPQVVYYFFAYADLLRNKAIQAGAKVNFVVPTGNFGDILAGYYAKLLGLPIDKLICAANRNDVLDEFIKTGIYNAKRPFYNTIAPSMDILISSNVERLLFELLDHDEKAVNELMKDLNQQGSYQLDMATTQKLQETFLSHRADDQQIRAAIRECYQKYQRVIDPHTATAYLAAKAFGRENTIILATASPYKFARDVLAALDINESDDFAAIARLASLNCEKVPENIEHLKDLKVRHQQVLKKEAIPAYLEHSVCLES